MRFEPSESIHILKARSNILIKFINYIAMQDRARVRQLHPSLGWRRSTDSLMTEAYPSLTALENTGTCNKADATQLIPMQQNCNSYSGPLDARIARQ